MCCRVSFAWVKIKPFDPVPAVPEMGCNGPIVSIMLCEKGLTQKGCPQYFKSTVHLSIFEKNIVFYQDKNVIEHEKIVGLFITLASFTISAQQSKFSNVYPFIENTAVFEINQTEGHTVCIPLKSVGEALNLQKSKSENVLSLNGR